MFRSSYDSSQKRPKQKSDFARLSRRLLPTSPKAQAQAVQFKMSSRPNAAIYCCPDTMIQCYSNGSIWERSSDRHHLHLLMLASTKPLRHVLCRHVAKFLKPPDELFCLQAIVERERRMARDGLFYSFAAFIYSPTTPGDAKQVQVCRFCLQKKWHASDDTYCETWNNTL